MKVDSISISNLQVSGTIILSGSLSYSGTLNAQALSGDLQGTSSYAQTTATASYISSSNIVGSVASSSYSLNTSLLFSTINFATSSRYPLANAYTSLGSKIKLIPIGEVDASSMGPAVSLNTAIVTMIALYVYEPTTINGVMWYQSVQGNYTVTTQYNGVAVYSYDGAGTLNLLISSSNNSNIWKASNTTWASQSFDTSYTISSEGLYYVCSHLGANTVTTAPTVGARNGATGANAPYGRPHKATNSALLHATSNTTPFPSTFAMSSLISTNLRPYFILY